MIGHDDEMVLDTLPPGAAVDKLCIGIGRNGDGARTVMFGTEEAKREEEDDDDEEEEGAVPAARSGSWDR
jgi:hypothetical protein